MAVIRLARCRKPHAMPTISSTPDANRLVQAVACLRQAIVLLEQVSPSALNGLNLVPIALSANGHDIPSRPIPASGNGSGPPLITDRQTFSVHWANRTCRLGNTMAYKLLERLARRPNQLIPSDLLLQELWDFHTSRDAVRSAAKVLRKKLSAAGMGDLAEAIDGSTAHHYGLMLQRRP
jgi:hypothetical protein